MQKRTFLKSALALGVALSAAPILTACSKAEPESRLPRRRLHPQLPRLRSLSPSRLL